MLYLIGLDYFEVSTGALTASMTAVVLPVIVLAVRRGVTARACISALFVLVGIVLALYPEIKTLSPEGFGIMAAGTIVRALFIVKLNDYAREHNPLALSLGISTLGAVFSFIPWCAMQPMTFLAPPWSTELIAAYFIFGYFIVGFATVLNIFAQRRASAVHSTIIYSTEIIFSVIWATLLPSEIVASPEITPHLVGGCLLVVLGNLIGDIVSNSLRWSSIAGFIGNFAYPFLLYLFWTKIRKKPFSLRTGGAIAALVASFVLCALVQTAIITPAVAYFYPQVDIPYFAATVFCNATLYPITFSIPFMILLQEELGFVPVGSHNSFELGLTKKPPRKLRLTKSDSDK